MKKLKKSAKIILISVAAVLSALAIVLGCVFGIKGKPNNNPSLTPEQQAFVSAQNKFFGYVNNSHGKTETLTQNTDYNEILDSYGLSFNNMFEIRDDYIFVAGPYGNEAIHYTKNNVSSPKFKTERLMAYVKTESEYLTLDILDVKNNVFAYMYTHTFVDEADDNREYTLRHYVFANFARAIEGDDPTIIFEIVAVEDGDKNIKFIVNKANNNEINETYDAIDVKIENDYFYVKYTKVEASGSATFRYDTVSYDSKSVPEKVVTPEPPEEGDISDDADSMSGDFWGNVVGGSTASNFSVFESSQIPTALEDVITITTLNSTGIRVVSFEGLDEMTTKFKFSSNGFFVNTKSKTFVSYISSNGANEFIFDEQSGNTYDYFLMTIGLVTEKLEDGTNNYSYTLLKFADGQTKSFNLSEGFAKATFANVNENYFSVFEQKLVDDDYLAADGQMHYYSIFDGRVVASYSANAVNDYILAELDGTVVSQFQILKCQAYKPSLSNVSNLKSHLGEDSNFEIVTKKFDTKQIVIKLQEDDADGKNVVVVGFDGSLKGKFHFDEIREYGNGIYFAKENGKDFMFNTKTLGQTEIYENYFAGGYFFSLNNLETKTWTMKDLEGNTVHKNIEEIFIPVGYEGVIPINLTFADGRKDYVLFDKNSVFEFGGTSLYDLKDLNEGKAVQTFAMFVENKKALEASGASGFDLITNASETNVVDNFAIDGLKVPYIVNLLGGTPPSSGGRNYMVNVSDISGSSTSGFALDTNGFYKSKNAAVNSSFSLCKVEFYAYAGTTVMFECISYGESNFDFGIMSNLDSTLSSDNTADSTCLKSFKGESSSLVSTVTYTISSTGSHFVYIKYRKDSSVNSNDDCFKFRMRDGCAATTAWVSLESLIPPTRVGYTFAGWTLQNLGGTNNTAYYGTSTSNYSTTNKYQIDVGPEITYFKGLRHDGLECVVFQARWSSIKYDVVIDLNGGNGSYDLVTKSIISNSLTVCSSNTISYGLFAYGIKMETLPTKLGYKFNGWYFSNMTSGDTHIIGGEFSMPVYTFGIIGGTNTTSSSYTFSSSSLIVPFQNLRCTPGTVTIQARWSPVNSYFSLNSNYKNTSTLPSLFSYYNMGFFNSSYSVTNSPSRTGYTLTGWKRNYGQEGILFNANSQPFRAGYSINDSGDIASTNLSYVSSTFISFNTSNYGTARTLISSINCSIYAYDASKNFISKISNNTTTHVVPAGVCYIRICYQGSEVINSFTIEEQDKGYIYHKGVNETSGELEDWTSGYVSQFISVSPDGASKTLTSGTPVSIYAYGKNFNYIGRVSSYVTTHNLPSGTYFIRIEVNDSYSGHPYSYRNSLSVYDSQTFSATSIKNLNTIQDKLIVYDAIFEPNTYTITLNNNGTTVGTLNVTYNTSWSPTSITPPTRTGYAFMGYYTGENGSGTQIINSSGSVVGSTTYFTSNSTIYAYWRDNQAPTISRIATEQNGNSGFYVYIYATDNVRVYRAQIFDLKIRGTVQSPSRVNASSGTYTYNGNSYNFRVYVDVSKYSNDYGPYNFCVKVGDSSANITNSTEQSFYFKFSISLYNDGSLYTTITETYYSGWSPTSVTVPTKEGFAFKGFYTGENGAGTQIVNSSGKTLESTSTFYKNNGSAYAYWVDSQAPTINRTAVQQDGNKGYYVYADVTDNVGVSKVCFPTWTDLNSQDDIQPDWPNNSAARGTFSSPAYTYNGQTYNFRYYVAVSDHNGEYGPYNTHIYAYDAAGNRVGLNGISSAIGTSEFHFRFFVILNSEGSTYASLTEIYNGGWAPTSVTVPTKTGFTFKGFYTGQNGTGTQIVDNTGKVVGSNTTFTDNATIYAYFVDSTNPTISRVAVQQNGNEGYYVYAQADDNVGVTRVRFPSWTHANNQDDLLWADGTAGSYSYNGNSYNYRYYVKVSEHNGEYGPYITHVYAYDAAGNSVCYQKNDIYFTFTVTLNKAGGGGGTNSFTQTYNSGFSVSSVTAPTRFGYNFEGYYTGTNGSGEQIVNASGSVVGRSTFATSNTSIYAKWSVQHYGITYILNADSSSTVGKFPADATITNTVGYTYSFSVPKPTRVGYNFLGWQISGMLDSITHYYYSPNEVAFSSTGGRYTEADNINNQITVDATSFKDLHALDGSTVTLTAIWEKRPYSIIYNHLPANYDATQNIADINLVSNMTAQTLVAVEYDKKTTALPAAYTSEAYGARVPRELVLIGWVFFSTERNGSYVVADSNGNPTASSNIYQAGSEFVFDFFKTSTGFEEGDVYAYAYYKPVTITIIYRVADSIENANDLNHYVEYSRTTASLGNNFTFESSIEGVVGFMISENNYINGSMTGGVGNKTSVTQYKFDGVDYTALAGVTAPWGYPSINSFNPEAPVYYLYAVYNVK